jgi:hypothetical protein
MRFMTIYKPGEESTTPPTQEHMEAMGKFIDHLAKEGVLITTDGLAHSSKGARVRMNGDGSFRITDGPFTETKEIIGGYAIVDVKSKAEAIELTKRFLKVCRRWRERDPRDVRPAGVRFTVAVAVWKRRVGACPTRSHAVASGRVRRQPRHRCRLENRVSATHCRPGAHHR